MEAQHETKPRGSKGVGLTVVTPVRRRSTRHLLQPPQMQPAMVFDPCDPYSSAMDNIPLKDLFPNVKVRKRPQGRKIEASDMPSPRNTESDDSVRSKLRDSLAAALRSVDSADWEQDRGRDGKIENQLGQDQAVLGSMETEEKMEKEVLASGLDHVVSEDNVVPDWKENLNKHDLMLDETSFLREENVDLGEMEETPYKRMKVEAERIEGDDTNKQNQASDLAERVAIDIELELYRRFGGVNRKYKERARSLLFNLKDRSNPELRSRVLTGETTPENLCSMNAEQLASKELSQWRMAKAEEFSHMVVLTDADADQPRLVKKTHKGEIEVTVEKDDVLTEAVTAGSQQRFALATKQETEETGANIVADPLTTNQDPDNVAIETDAEGLEFSPIRELNFTVGMSVPTDQVHNMWMQDASMELGEAEMESASQEEGDTSLPAIMSLDEFLGSKKGKEPKVAVIADELELKLGRNEIKPNASVSQINTVNTPSSMSLKDRVPRKAVGSPNRKPSESGSTKNGGMSQKERKKEHRVNEKLWEGSFQLSGCQISPVLAIFKSGHGMKLQSWPKLVEIKGRVRLDALEKFLQELRLSRTRAVMIIACRVDEGQTDHGASVNALKEAANQYQRGERVGYAEPVPGYELYLFPGGGTSLKLLVEHGYLKMDQILAEEEGILVGCVVCRRSLIPTNATHKSSSHYFNANRHALSAQLDSPTRPNETQWTGNVAATSNTPSLPLPPSSKEFENHDASVPFMNLQKGVSFPNNNVEGSVLTAENKSMSEQMTHKPSGPDSIFSWSIQPPQDPRSGKVKPDWSQKDLMKDEDVGEDLPPGFGPKVMAMANRGHEEDGDDDLPEYDFSAQNLFPNLNNVKPPEVHMEGPPLPPHPQPFGMQVSFPQGSVFPPLPQAPQGSVGRLSSQPETSIPFDQFNPSAQHPPQFPRPILSHVRGSLEHGRPHLLLSPQVSHPIRFHAAGPWPPAGPSPGSTPFNVFPPRPHLSGDGSFAAARVPSAAQMPVPNVLHAEQKDAFGAILNQPSQNHPILPRPYGDLVRPENASGIQDQRTRAALPVVQSHPIPFSHTPAGPGHRRGMNQASSLWDDDDMPEWCPPTVPQKKNRQIPRPPVLPVIEPDPGVPPRGMIPPPMGRGWQRMPPRLMVRLEGDGRGILQAPPPPVRYPVPTSGGVFPIARPEQFLADRSQSTRPNEPRDFKSGK